MAAQSRNFAVIICGLYIFTAERKTANSVSGSALFPPLIEIQQVLLSSNQRIWCDVQKMSDLTFHVDSSQMVVGGSLQMLNYSNQQL